MKFDTEGNIWFRQSWIDTAMRCPERGRLSMVRPEYDFGGDAAHLGTGAHAAIEADLTALAVGSAVPDDEQRWAIICNAIAEKIEEEGVRWNKYTTFEQLAENAERCYQAWRTGILPVMYERNLVEGALLEHKFKAVLFTLADGRTVGIEGTSDLMPRANEVWDWKTAGQPYRIKEKQKGAIQPTIYTLAAILGQGHPEVEYSYPMNFTYGVMIRGAKVAKPQLVTVTRTQAHADFAIERIKSYLDLALNFTVDRPWPRNDDHYLCSQTWCPWWFICKGGNQINDTPPPQLEAA